MEYVISENKSLIDLNLLNKLYPVGTVYTTVSDINPNTVFGGTWVKIASGRCLMGADSSHGVGTTANAGLPNITGGCHNLGHTTNVTYGINTSDSGWHGSFSASDTVPCYPVAATNLYSDGSKNSGFYFDASRSSSIYGNSATVQPPALFVYFWQRTG